MEMLSTPQLGARPLQMKTCMRTHRHTRVHAHAHADFQLSFPQHRAVSQGLALHFQGSEPRESGSEAGKGLT